MIGLERNRFSAAAFAFLGVLGGSLGGASAMNLAVAGDQLILSGPVIGDEYPKVEQILAAAPAIDTIILRNSTGGDIPTGFRLGDLFRQKSLQTAVSGFCYSSCSRMFLGGKRRFFTDDFPPDLTNVGFHGHYDRTGHLAPKVVERTGLVQWIIEHSDGKADPALVERWVRIPRNNGLIHFYDPDRFERGGASTFMCQGDEPMGSPAIGCEPIPKTALDLGIVTSLEVVKSHDQGAVRAAIGAWPKASGYAAIDDLDIAPIRSDRVRLQYQRFLRAGLPRAFVVSGDGQHFMWSAGQFDALSRLLTACESLSAQPCKPYAVDDDVVWTPNG
jgi:hypothetical protein